MKTRSENLRSKRLGKLDKCWLDIVGMKISLVGEDVRHFPTNGNKCISWEGAEGCNVKPSLPDQWM